MSKPSQEYNSFLQTLVDIVLRLFLSHVYDFAHFEYTLSSVFLFIEYNFMAVLNSFYYIVCDVHHVL